MRISDWSSDVCSSDLRRFEVADQTQHIRGQQTADRASRIDSRHDPAFGTEDEAGCLATDGIVIDEGTGGSGKRPCIGTVGDQKTEPVLFDKRTRLFPLYPPYHDDAYVFFRQVIGNTPDRGNIIQT